MTVSVLTGLCFAKQFAVINGNLNLGGDCSLTDTGVMMPVPILL